MIIYSFFDEDILIKIVTDYEKQFKKAIKLVYLLIKQKKEKNTSWINILDGIVLIMNSLTCLNYGEITSSIIKVLSILLLSTKYQSY